jgi:hypothetical protein
MKSGVGTKQLRSFGLMVGGVFGVLGAWPAVVHHLEPRLWALALAVLLIVPGAVRPSLLAHPYRAWMTLGHALGWFNTRIILGIFFYLILTPLGVVRRWLGKDSMRMSFDASASTYRLSRKPRPGSHMRQQF